MTKEHIEETAISIITKAHERYDTHEVEDLVYIPFLKTIVEGAAECAGDNEMPLDVVESIRKELSEYCKSIYIAGHQLKSTEAENPEEDREQAGIWFDYLYENESYPE